MDNLLLFIGTISVGFGAYLKYEYNYNHPSKISSKVAKSLIDCKNTNVKVIDVRTEFEYKSGTVSRNINGISTNISINIQGNNITETILLQNNIKPTDNIIVFCNSGTRARQAADKLIELNYENVFYIVETYKSLNL